MPRIRPYTLTASPYLQLLVAATRDLQSAKAELQWIKDYAKTKSRNPHTLVYELCSQRAKGKPLQYILGDVPFGPLNIKCQKRVLIPRWETEEWSMRLAETILKNRKNQKVKIVDLCTGTGCVALFLKSAIPDSDVLGVDISSAAVNLARRNAADNIIDMQFIQGDIFSDLPLIDTVDILTANPPYILSSEFKLLHRSVRLYEPEIAVNGGDYFYCRILELAKTWKAKILVLEAGDLSQCQRIKSLAVKQNWNASVGFDGASEGRYIVCWRIGYDWANAVCNS